MNKVIKLLFYLSTIFILYFIIYSLVLLIQQLSTVNFGEFVNSEFNVVLILYSICGNIIIGIIFFIIFLFNKDINQKIKIFYIKLPIIYAVFLIWYYLSIILIYFTPFGIFLKDLL